MYVCMYVCIDVWLHLCIFCMSGLTISTLAQGIKNCLASQVWFQAVVGSRTYGTNSPVSHANHLATETSHVCMYSLKTILLNNTLSHDSGPFLVTSCCPLTGSEGRKAVLCHACIGHTHLTHSYIIKRDLPLWAERFGKVRGCALDRHA